MVQVQNLFGQYRLTADACGTNGASCVITISKPANATTVHRAYVYYSTVPFYPDPGASALTMSGGIPSTTLNLPNITQANALNSTSAMITRYGDVTAVFASALNTLAAGNNINFNIAESPSNQIDGSGMIVIWNCPSQPNTVVHLSIGSGNTGVGVTGNIPTPPINTSLPTYRAWFGSGYTFSTASGSQIATCRVNNTVIDTQCGGYDDGGLFNGGLVTLGGFGDNPAAVSDELNDVSNLIAMNSTNVTYQVNMTTSHSWDWLDIVWLEIVNDVPLPIELAEFTASVVGEDVELNWKTTEELNSDFFEIERSADGANFEAIDKVDAAGNATTETVYQVYDYEPLPGRSYYRLRSMDLDGVESYSEIRTVTIGQPTVISVYPTPARENFTFVYGGEGGDMRVELFDTKGARVLLQEFRDLEAGIHKNVAIGELKQGIYIAKFFFDGQQAVHKIIVAD